MQTQGLEGTLPLVKEQSFVMGMCFYVDEACHVTNMFAQEQIEVNKDTEESALIMVRDAGVQNVACSSEEERQNKGGGLIPRPQWFALRCAYARTRASVRLLRATGFRPYSGRNSRETYVAGCARALRLGFRVMSQNPSRAFRSISSTLTPWTATAASPTRTSSASWNSWLVRRPA